MNKKIKNGTSWRGVPLFVIAQRYMHPNIPLETKSVLTFNFVSEKWMNCEDLESLGFEKESCIPMHEKYTWATIAANVGLFPSVGTAKKSDWNHPIKDGYSEAFFTKSDGTPLFVFILK